MSWKSRHARIEGDTMPMITKTGRAKKRWKVLKFPTFPSGIIILVDMASTPQNIEAPQNWMGEIRDTTFNHVAIRNATT